MARKLVILAREMGMQLELADVALEGLIPPALVGVGVEEFMARLTELDAPMLARLEAARARNHVLRYVGALDAASNRATVGLVELERSHPFANINLTDNVVRFVTSRYDQNPLVVQGPGAGPAVTAGGVFADLLRVCSVLGRKNLNAEKTSRADRGARRPRNLEAVADARRDLREIQLAGHLVGAAIAVADVEVGAAGTDAHAERGLDHGARLAFTGEGEVRFAEPKSLKTARVTSPRRASTTVRLRLMTPAPPPTYGRMEPLPNTYLPPTTKLTPRSRPLSDQRSPVRLVNLFAWSSRPSRSGCPIRFSK